MITNQELIELAKTTLKAEANNINNISNNLGEDFLKCIDMIATMKGKMILSGVGKSGIIAKKIASSLTSISIPSLFIHPVEAFHGDFGLINNDDIILTLSNSGKTEEMIRFLQQVKDRGCKIIAMTGNRDTPIAKISDIILEIPITHEDPIFNLIPTSSIIAHCAMGDAIIASLLKVKNITKDDFLYNHPGGTLGK